MRRAILIIVWTLSCSAGYMIATEESFYYFAPIAVAVLAYLMDARQARRYELEADSIKDRVRSLEESRAHGIPEAELRISLLEKTTEHHDKRLDALEGMEPGVAREHGEKLQAAVVNLDNNVKDIAYAHNMLEHRIKRISPPEEDE